VTFAKGLRVGAVIAATIGVLGLAIAQIMRVDTATKLEVVFFNIFQFALSLLIGWLLSHSLSEETFREAQRRFAVAAFRRIMAIERSLLRLQSRLDVPATATREQLRETMSVARIGLDAAQDNVRSSIADWGDVIGDEIHVAREVSRLKGLREVEKDPTGRIEASSSDLAELNKQIQALKEKLPATIRAEVDADEFDFSEAATGIRNRLLNNQLVFSVYWDALDSWDRTPNDVSVGDSVLVARVITENRGEVLIVYDKDHHKVGVVINDFGDDGIPYDNFTMTMRDVFGSLMVERSTALKATVLEILPLRKPKGPDEEEGQHFRILIPPELNKMLPPEE
jgi:hypothetical protein